jgi:arylsulfatase A-like enzyme
MRPDDGWLTTSATSQNGRPRLQGTSQLPATLVLRNPLEKVVKTRLIFFSHEDYSEQRLRELYAGETAYLDQQIGRLLRQLDEQDRWRDTIVVFTSDHGEGLGDHGRSGHIDQLYDSLLRVPLLIIAEGLIPSNEVVDLPVRLIDLLPTVLDLAGIPTPAGVHGTSLVPLMTDPTGGGPLPVIGSTYRPLAEFDQRSLIQFPYKYIVNLQTMDEELYDLRADPKEQSNLATSRPDLTTRMRLALEQSVAGLSSDAQDEAVTPELSQEEIDQLEALGYVN